MMYAVAVPATGVSAAPFHRRDVGCVAIARVWCHGRLPVLASGLGSSLVTSARRGPSPRETVSGQRGTAFSPNWDAAVTGPTVRRQPMRAGPRFRVEVEHLPRPTARAEKAQCVCWSGPGEPNLDLCWRAYLRRLDIEILLRGQGRKPTSCQPRRDRGPKSLDLPRLARGRVVDRDGPATFEFSGRPAVLSCLRTLTACSTNVIAACEYIGDTTQ